MENQEIPQSGRALTMQEQMKAYTGTKTIHAVEMSQGSYEHYMGNAIKPDAEEHNTPGYLVEYEPDPSSKANHENHDGYVSWSPKQVFDKAYKLSETFGDRLIIEGAELTEKIEKLQTALDKKLVPVSEESILGAQLSAMTTYLNILTIRMEKLYCGKEIPNS